VSIRRLVVHVAVPGQFHTLSLHDALPIWSRFRAPGCGVDGPDRAQPGRVGAPWLSWRGRAGAGPEAAGWERAGSAGVTEPGVGRPRLVDRPQRRPAAVAGDERAEHPDDDGGVADPAREHRVDGVLQAGPAHRHTGLLVLAVVPLALRDVGQVAGEVDAQRLVHAAG